MAWSASATFWKAVSTVPAVLRRRLVIGGLGRPLPVQKGPPLKDRLRHVARQGPEPGARA